MNDPAKETSAETSDQSPTTSDIRELLGERNVLNSVRVKMLLIMGGMLLLGAGMGVGIGYGRGVSEGYKLGLAAALSARPCDPTNCGKLIENGCPKVCPASGWGPCQPGC